MDILMRNRLTGRLKSPAMWLAALLLSFSVQAESVLVVANTDNSSMSLTRLEVRDLFMGGVSDASLTAIALPPNNLTRITFNTKVIGLTESRIQAYWAQMRFSGRKRPPIEFQNEAAALKYLMANQGAVGYFPAGMPLPEGLTVLYRSE